METITITENGVYVPEEGGYSEVIVDIQSTKTVEMTLAEYNALPVKDNNTIYLING